MSLAQPSLMTRRDKRIQLLRSALCVMCAWVVGCGTSTEDRHSEPVAEVGACASFDLELVARHEIAAMAGDSTRLIAGAIGGGEIRVLLLKLDGPAPVSEMLRLDPDDKSLLGRTSLSAPDCNVVSITHRTGEWLALAECGTPSASTATVLSIDDSGATTPLFSVTEPDARQLASDADGSFWINGYDGVFFAPSAGSSFEKLDMAPLGWGMTSGFDHFGDVLAFARDAREAGMANMLAFRKDAASAELCKFDVEGVPGFAGEENLVVFGDGSTVFALTPNGVLAELMLHEAS